MDLLDALHHLSHALAPLQNGTVHRRTHSDTPNSDDTTLTKSYGVAPVDIVETANNYTFILDVPGLSKSDIQVLLEEEKVLVVKSSGKRKREEEEEEVKYLRMERNGSPKFLRKFRLPQDADLEAIKASCEIGVLTVSVGKLAPPEPKKKTVEVTVA